MTPNRIVVVLTPLLFAPAAGWLTAWVGRNAPGLPALDPGEVTALFVAGATIAFGKAALWLHGWHLFEQSPDGRIARVADDDEAERDAAAVLAGVPLHPTGEYEADVDNDAAGMPSDGDASSLPVA